MQYKIVSTQSPLKDVLGAFQQLTNTYRSSGSHNPAVLDFLVSVRKNIKWAIEMNDRRPIPFVALNACLNKTITGEQLAVLQDWLNRKTPLTFWVEKFNKKSDPLYERFETFQYRIGMFLEDDKLLVDSKGLVGCAEILCRFNYANFEPLIHCLNETHQDVAVEFMESIFKIPSTSTNSFLGKWLNTKGFFLHPHFNLLVEEYLFNAIKNKGLNDLTQKLIDTIFGDSRYRAIHGVFSRVNEDICKFEHKKLFAKDLLSYVMGKGDGLISNHLYKLSQGSSVSRLVFYCAYEPESLATIMQNDIPQNRQNVINNLKGVFFEHLQLEYDRNIQFHTIFHPLFINLGPLLRCFQEAPLKLQLKSLFLNLIENSQPDTIEHPQQVKSTLDGIKTKLWKLSINIHDRDLIKNIFEKINHVFNKVSAIDIKDKSDSLSEILSSLLHIKMQDIESERKKGAILNQIDGYFSTVQNLSSLKTAIEIMKNQFIHFLLNERYSDSDAELWFKMLNQHLEEDMVNNIIRGVGTLREQSKPDLRNRNNADLFNPSIMDVLKANKFLHIHGPQMQALSVVEQYVDEYNLFIKQPTGQGKSLTAELSAISMLKKNPDMTHVFIFTSYKHLAKRDQENMRFLVEAYGYKTVLLKSHNDLFELVDSGKHIVHVEYESFKKILFDFFNTISNSTNPLSDRDKQVIDILLDVKKTGLILDEFDLMTLDLDSNTINNYYHVKLTNKFPKFEVDYREQTLKNWFFKDIHSDDAVRTLFANKISVENSEIKKKDEAFEKYVKERMDSRYCDQTEKDYNKEALSNGHYCENQPNRASGSSHWQIVTSKRSKQFESAECQIFVLNFLAYICQFKSCICLSGSIEDQHMAALRGTNNENLLFDNGKENLLIKLPSFFGLQREGINRREDEPICIDKSKWKDAIVQNIKNALNNNQPVLLFFDSERFEDGTVDSIKLDLKDNTQSQQKQLRIQMITEEAHIKDRIDNVGKQNTVTFATVIIGRGVDISVDESVTEGLHVIIADLPFKNIVDKNNNVTRKRIDRLITQMKGRTARQDRCGSVSIIIHKDDDPNKQEYYDLNNKPPETLPDNNFKAFDAARHFFSKVRETYALIPIDIIKKWAMYQRFDIPDDHELKNNPKAFIDSFILNKQTISFEESKS